MKQVIDNGVKIEVEDTTPTKMIDGRRYLLTPAEKTEQAARVVEREAGATNRNTLQEITRLEGETTPRRMREAILGNDGGWLANQDVLIASERGKL